MDNSGYKIHSYQHETYFLPIDSLLLTIFQTKRTWLETEKLKQILTNVPLSPLKLTGDYLIEFDIKKLNVEYKNEKSL